MSKLVPDHRLWEPEEIRERIKAIERKRDSILDKEPPPSHEAYQKRDAQVRRLYLRRLELLTRLKGLSHDDTE